MRRAQVQERSLKDSQRYIGTVIPHCLFVKAFSLINRQNYQQRMSIIRQKFMVIRTWNTEVWFLAVERYYIKNFNLPEGLILEESDVKALSNKLQEVIAWFRRREEHFSFKKVTIQGHDTYAFSTSMHDVDHIFVFDSDGRILKVIERYEACGKDGDETVEGISARDCPEQYWRHAE